MSLQAPAIDIEAAWCAGYLDGEGSFSAVKGSPEAHWSPCLRAWSTDRESLQRLQAFLGGTIHIATHRPGKTTGFSWYLNLSLLDKGLRTLLPHLTAKRVDAELMLSMFGASSAKRELAARALRARKTKPGRRTAGPLALPTPAGAPR